MRWLLLIAAFGLLCTLFRPALANSWAGHLATLSDARSACGDINSDSCVPYVSEAVAIADTLHTQASFDAQNGELHIPGADGSIVTCNPKSLEVLDGSDLARSALGMTPPENGGDPFYWSDALFKAAVKMCQTADPRIPLAGDVPVPPPPGEPYSQ
jgi:hypothetical protein